MTLLTPSALWLLALLPVVIALHFVRRRRAPRQVPALFLWRRAEAALARRTRFSPTWLLALQLLFITLAALALARPTPTADEARAVAIIIDASASMTARDANGTRLETAKRGAATLMTRASSAALIRAGVNATLQAPIAPPHELSGALSELEAGDHTSDLPEAVRLARAALPGAEVHVFTDHPVSLGDLTLHRVDADEPPENVGITAFGIGYNQAFVAVASSGARPTQSEVELWQGDRRLAAGTVFIPAGAPGSITLPLLDVAGVVEARLIPPPGDALELDDVAYAGAPALRVTTSDASGPLLRALSAVPRTQVSVMRGATAERPADLRVVTGVDPDALPPGNHLLLPPEANEPRYVVIADHDRAHPLMRFVDPRDAVVGLAESFGGWEDPEQEWRVLARARDLTPLLRVRRDEAGLTLQFAFHPSQSDLVLRPAFPALIKNLLQELGDRSGIRLGEALPGGVEPILTPGVYELRADNGEQAGGATLVHASLLSEAESRLAGAQPITRPAAGAEANRIAGAEEAPALPATEVGSARSDRESGAPPAAATWLLLLAALTLTAEWLLHPLATTRQLVG